jgi:hypothetical protein
MKLKTLTIQEIGTYTRACLPRHEKKMPVNVVAIEIIVNFAE